MWIELRRPILDGVLDFSNLVIFEGSMSKTQKPMQPDFDPMDVNKWWLILKPCWPLKQWVVSWADVTWFWCLVVLLKFGHFWGCKEHDPQTCVRRLGPNQHQWIKAHFRALAMAKKNGHDLNEWDPPFMHCQATEILVIHEGEKPKHTNPHNFGKNGVITIQLFLVDVSSSKPKHQWVLVCVKPWGLCLGGSLWSKMTLEPCPTQPGTQTQPFCMSDGSSWLLGHEWKKNSWLERIWSLQVVTIWGIQKMTLGIPEMTPKTRLWGTCHPLFSIFFFWLWPPCPDWSWDEVFVETPVLEHLCFWLFILHTKWAQSTILILKLRKKTPVGAVTTIQAQIAQMDPKEVIWCLNLCAAHLVDVVEVDRGGQFSSSGAHGNWMCKLKSTKTTRQCHKHGHGCMNGPWHVVTHHETSFKQLHHHLPHVVHEELELFDLFSWFAPKSRCERSVSVLCVVLGLWSTKLKDWPTKFFTHVTRDDIGHNSHSKQTQIGQDGFFWCFWGFEHTKFGHKHTQNLHKNDDRVNHSFCLNNSSSKQDFFHQLDGTWPQVLWPQGSQALKNDPKCLHAVWGLNSNCFQKSQSHCDCMVTNIPKKTVIFKMWPCKCPKRSPEILDFEKGMGTHLCSHNDLERQLWVIVTEFWCLTIGLLIDKKIPPTSPMLPTCPKWTFVTFTSQSLQWPHQSNMSHCDWINIIERFINRIFEKIILSAQAGPNTYDSSSLRYIFYRGGLSCVRERPTYNQTSKQFFNFVHKAPKSLFWVLSSSLRYIFYRGGLSCVRECRTCNQTSKNFQKIIHLKSMGFQFPSSNSAHGWACAAAHTILVCVPTCHRTDYC